MSIDFLGPPAIKHAANLVRQYNEHLILLKGRIELESGVAASEEFSRAIALIGALQAHLESPPDRTHVQLETDFARAYVAAVKWLRNESRDKIDELRSRGATAALLSEPATQMKRLEEILDSSVLRPYLDEEPLLTEKYFGRTQGSGAENGMRAPEPKKCFIVIASDKDDSHRHEERYRNSIEPAIRESGYTPVRNADDHDPNWFGGMIRHLRTCELAVVDLTDMRPNCIWELGILNAWDVPLVIVSPKEPSLPTDIFTQRVSVFYEGQSSEQLKLLRSELVKKIPSVMAHEQRGKFLPPLIGYDNDSAKD